MPCSWRVPLLRPRTPQTGDGCCVFRGRTSAFSKLSPGCVLRIWRSFPQDVLGSSSGCLIWQEAPSQAKTLFSDCQNHEMELMCWRHRNAASLLANNDMFVDEQTVDGRSTGEGNAKVLTSGPEWPIYLQFWVARGWRGRRRRALTHSQGCLPNLGIHNAFEM
jgi:hypothetical protein